jgi:HNH endonuclease
MTAQKNLTDRAKRYRANREGTRPQDPAVCGYCGSTRNVEVDHVDGVESHGWPGNLIWACRACNTRKGAHFRRVGVGVPTAQFNPAAPVSSYSDWADLCDAVRGDLPASRADVLQAVRRIQATPADLRRRFAERMRKNPGILTAAQYLGSVEAFSSLKDTDAFRGLDEQVRKVMNTPHGRFDRFAAAMRRKNPRINYPTYQQYAFAVSIIHATPPAARSEYAARIVEVKRRRRAEVPF